MNPHLLIFLGAVSNLFAVYPMKVAAGMTKPWPSLGMVVSILLTQWLVSQAMENGAEGVTGRDCSCGGGHHWVPLDGTISVSERLERGNGLD